jgi:hypothetical protein
MIHLVQTLQTIRLDVVAHQGLSRLEQELE